MRLEHWLFGALSIAALACSSDSPGLTSDKGGASDEDDDDDDDDKSPAKPDAGPKKDAGRAPIAGGDDDDDDSNTDNDDTGEETVCDSVQIQAKPNAPQILIVLDRSGSMIGQGQGEPIKNRWEPSAAAVKKITSELNGLVDFGLMLFPQPAAMMPSTGGGGRGGLFGGGGGGNPLAAACTPGKVDVAVKPNSAQAIASAIDMGAPDQFAMTPTALTLEEANKVFMGMNQSCADCGSAPKFVLLVTDGQPTCGMGGAGGMGAMVDPAQVEATNAAIDKLRMADVKTYVVGYDTKMDMALATTMDGFAMHGGTETHLAVENEADLTAQLRSIASSLISCEYTLNEDVDDPNLVKVLIDGEEFPLGQGWSIDGRKVTLGEDGDGICPKIKDGKVHAVRIRKDCAERDFQ